MVKVLICGDIDGNIKDVSNRVNKYATSKVGPFDVLFCVGKFLDENNQIQIDSSISFSLPTYVVLKDDVISDELRDQLSKVKNLTLVTDVSFQTINDLRVLFIPGIYDEKEYTNNNSSSSSVYYHKSQIEQAIAASGEANVDFVFSAEWALGMLRNLDNSRFPSIPDCHSVGSPIISRVLASVRPRYHLAGSMNTFYERVPYRNIDGTITRIVCLGPVRAGSDKSRKWLHALNVVPASQMSAEERKQCDSFATKSPFDSFKRAQGAADSVPDKRVNAGESVGAAESAVRSSCWFCLAAPNVEKHLIVTVGENAYLACPKGQLTAGHILIIPVVHRQSTLQLPKEAVEEMEKYKKALVKMFRAQGKSVLIWERNLTTRNPLHCHLQVVPIETTKESVVKIVLDAAATQRGFHFQDIPEGQKLEDWAGKDDYLYAEVWGEKEIPKRFGYVVKEKRPQMQFFHQAVGSLLEAENVGDDWKALQKSVEEETKITSEFREAFKPYDIFEKEASS